MDAIAQKRIRRALALAVVVLGTTTALVITAPAQPETDTSVTTTTADPVLLPEGRRVLERDDQGRPTLIEVSEHSASP